MTFKESQIKHNTNVLEMIIVKISKYFNKKIYISDLIYDLESYGNHLTLFDKQWIKDFRTAWLDMEIAYASALDQGLDKPVGEGDKIVTDSLNILTKMAQDKISDLKNEL